MPGVIGRLEAKTVAGTGGSVAGVAVSYLLLWLLGVVVWDAPKSAGHVQDAVSAVPGPVAVVVGLAVTGAATFLSAYLARHTFRPDLTPPAPLPPAG